MTLPATFWKRIELPWAPLDAASDVERARIQKEDTIEAEAFFTKLQTERMRAVDALDKRDNALYSPDPNARRLKDLSKTERAAIEANVTALTDSILSEGPPDCVYFDANDGWRCTCAKCKAMERRR